ncbi:MAG: hypothetical protein VX468_01085 [Pseudomonadota bacterium]|nr:hypothetical protein [Pseudomonadota bacterium]
MTTLAPQFLVSKAHMIDHTKLKLTHVSEMPEDTFKNLIEAQEIAAAMGGTVVKADTTFTQQSDNATEETKPMVDYKTMHNDPLYGAPLKTKQVRTEYIAQQMEQDITKTTTASLETNSSNKTSSDAFQEYMDMTPEERYIMQALAHRGYTKEEFDMLPLEEQEKILKEIREELREQTQTQTESGQTGFNATNDTAEEQDIVTQIITITNLLDKQEQTQDDYKLNS